MERVLAAVIVGSVVGLASAQFLGGRWWMMLSIVAVVVSLVAATRIKGAELRATKVEFVT